MRYPFNSVEKYLVKHVQYPFEMNEANGVLRKNLMMVRVALYQYFRTKDMQTEPKWQKYACHQLEILRKQIKEILHNYQYHQSLAKTIDCLLMILDSLLDVSGFRTTRKVNGYRDITLANIKITNKETMHSEYINKLGISAFLICCYLSLEYPSEMDEDGKIIDKFFFAKKVMVEKNIEESLTNYVAMGKEEGADLKI